jgi:hypothetical protein
MLPLCLILGDSTVVGTPGALAAEGICCEAHAPEGAPSSETLWTYQGGLLADVVLMALGSKDASNPQTRSECLRFGAWFRQRARPGSHLTI